MRTLESLLNTMLLKFIANGAIAERTKLSLPGKRKGPPIEALQAVLPSCVLRRIPSALKVAKCIPSTSMSSQLEQAPSFSTMISLILENCFTSFPFWSFITEYSFVQYSMQNLVFETSLIKFVAPCRRQGDIYDHFSRRRCINKQREW